MFGARHGVPVLHGMMSGHAVGARHGVPQRRAKLVNSGVRKYEESQGVGSSQKVVMRPLPLTSVSPRGIRDQGTGNWELESNKANGSLTWMRPGSQVLSILLAMLTVSPQMSY